MDITKKMTEVRSSDKMPPVYQTYMAKELAWVTESISNAQNILDAGCGEGRVTKHLLPLTVKYTGIDYDSAAIATAIKNIESEKVTFYEMDMTNMNAFEDSQFDTTVCLWNTIGNIENERKALEEIYRVTEKDFYVNFLNKGALAHRELYYQSYGVDYTIDPETETIYSNAWGFSKAHKLEDFISLVESVGFTKKSVTELGPLGFGVVFSR